MAPDFTADVKNPKNQSLTFVRLFTNQHKNAIRATTAIKLFAIVSTVVFETQIDVNGK